MKFTKTILLVSLFALQSYLIRFQIGPYPSNLQEILTIILLLSFLTETAYNKNIKKTLKNLKKHWILISFAALTIISILTVPISNFLDFARHTKFLTFALITAYVFTETLNKKSEQTHALKIAGYGAIAFGIFSAIYNLLGFNVAYDHRLLGPLDAAVYLGFYLTPFFLIFSTQFLEKKKKTDLISAIILAILIIATRSMGSIGGSFLALTIFLAKKYSKSIFKNKKAIAAIVIIGILIAGAIFQTKILPTLNTKYSSLDERGEIWATSFHLLKTPKNDLLGLGFGQFEDTYIKNVDEVLGRQPLDYKVIQPHNIFLLFIFHYGILGLALLITLMIKTTTAFIRSPKITIKTAGQIVMFYIFLHGLIDTPLFKNDMLIILLVFLELALYERPEARSIKTA